MGKLNLKGILENEWVIHLPIWLGWILIMNAGDSNGFGYYSQTRHNILVPLIINTSFNIVFFYGNALWLAPKHLKSGKAFLYLGLLILFSAIFIFAKTAAEKLYINNFLQDLQSVPIGSLIRENLYSLPVFCIGSYMFFRYWKSKREREWLTQDKLRQELALMKAQVSPHFLFNALNNLYSLGVQGNQKKVTEGILKLSDLLRYMIYEGQADHIRLEKELAYINDFVEVNKLMMNENELDQVHCIIKGDTADYKIPPMLLVTFVENAFKYGLSHNGKTDIDIVSEIDNGLLIFSVQNRVIRSGRAQNPGKPDSGLGLKNVRRQLELLYRNDHDLQIGEENGYFKVVLKIKLKE